MAGRTNDNARWQAGAVRDHRNSRQLDSNARNVHARLPLGVAL